MYWTLIFVTAIFYGIALLLYLSLGESVYNQSLGRYVTQRIKIPVWMIIVITIAFWIPVLNVSVGIVNILLILAWADGFIEPFKPIGRFLSKKI